MVGEEILPFFVVLPLDAGRLDIGEGAFRLLLDDLAGEPRFSNYCGFFRFLCLFTIITGASHVDVYIRNTRG